MFDVKGWVRLAEGEDKRIRDGHLWIYRNEIAAKGGDFTGGDVIWVEDGRGRKLGRGCVNLDSVISVRLLSRGAREPFDEGVFAQRLERAITRRKHLAPDAKRLVNAEGDLLPGLIVDVYRDTAVLQVHSMCWEKRKDFVVAEIDRLLRPQAIVLRNDSLSRAAEGLERYTAVSKGRIDGNVVITEGEIELEVDVLGGQKTGFYIDQRDNRRLPLALVPGKRVLDCCSYSGAWSLMCAKAGADDVLGVDASAPAIDLARRNAERNGLTDITHFAVADIFEDLQHRAAQREKFGVVILDPPSLARSKRSISGAERGYTHLNRLALGLLEAGGILVTCSCSHHISAERFREILAKAASLARKQVSILKTGGQPEDHPSLLGLPETTYLKCFMLRVE